MTLPRLLDRRQIAEELNVKLATAENIMRHLPIITIGRRCFVTDRAVADYLKKAESKS